MLNEHLNLSAKIITDGLCCKDPQSMPALSRWRRRPRRCSSPACLSTGPGCCCASGRTGGPSVTLLVPGSMCLTPPVIAEEMFQAVSRALDRYSWWSVPTQQLGRVMVANSGRADTKQVELQYCTVQYCTVLYCTVLYITPSRWRCSNTGTSWPGQHKSSR